MASNVGDRILWTAVLGTAIVAYYYIPHYLHHVKDLTTVLTSPKKPIKPQLEKDAEAAIENSTLAQLAEGSSYNLAASSIRLTAGRFVKSEAKADLLRDLSSIDWRRRDRAVSAFRLLLTDPALKESAIAKQFTDENTFSAFVTALANLLPEHEKNAKTTEAPSSPVKPARRSAHERALLEFLLILIEQPRNFGSNSCYVVDAQPAINAGIITRWLQFYPFPCTLPQNRHYNFKRHDAVRLLGREVWGQDDMQMCRLVELLIRLPSGARQLADVGLRLSSLHDRATIGSREWAVRSHPTLTFDDVLMVDGNDDDTDDDDGDDGMGELISDAEMMRRLQEPQARNQSGNTAGEQSRRRRHRQAVVLAEAGAPLGPENILQRQPTETEVTWQQENRRSAAGFMLDQATRERIDGLGSSNLLGGPLPPDIDLPMEMHGDQHEAVSRVDDATNDMQGQESNSED